MSARSIQLALTRPPSLRDRHVFVVVAVLTLAVFWRSYHALLPLAGSESAYAVLILVPVAAFGLMLFMLPPPERFGEELFANAAFSAPLFCAFVALLVFMPAQQSFAYGVYRFDLLAVPAFVGMALVLFYGLPGLWAARPALLLLLLGWPPVLDVVLRWTAPPLSRLDALFASVLAGPFVSASRAGDAVTVGHGAHRVTLAIASSCAGLLAVTSMVVLGGAVALAARGRAERRLAWLGTGIALALALNILRIAAILVVAGTWGSGAALGVFHYASGVLLFAGGFFLMLMLLPRFGVSLLRPRIVEEQERVVQPRNASVILGALAVVAAFGVFAAQALDFRPPGLYFGSPRVALAKPLAVVGGATVSDKGTAPWIATLFGSGAHAIVYDLEDKQSIPFEAQVVLAPSLGDLGRYDILDCFLTHGYSIYATRTIGLPHGGTALLAAIRADGRDLSTVTWVQPVVVNGKNMWRRTTLYEYLDKRRGDVAHVADVHGPLGLWFVNLVAPLGTSHVPERFKPSASDLQLKAAAIVDAT
jgi:exosortase/archaeosortase family protein